MIEKKFRVTELAREIAFYATLANKADSVRRDGYSATSLNVGPEKLRELHRLITRKGTSLWSEARWYTP